MQRKFIELLEQNQNIIHKVANLYTRDLNEKEEIFQEILYQAWSSFPGFRAESKFSTWLYRIALNTAITNYKKRKKRSIPFDYDQLTYYTERTEENHNEQVEILYRLINLLSPLDKALMMLYIDDYDYHEMSHILGISVSNVGVKINRIKQFLKTEGMKYFPG